MRRSQTAATGQRNLDSYSKNLPVSMHGKILRSKPKGFRNYGVGDAVVVVVSVVLVDVPGVEVAAGLVVVVLVLSEVLDDPPAGEGFTMVVFDWSGAGEAAGATVSVFCSQAASSAALARMQMYFFIMLRIGCAHIWAKG